jgi:hypothetical protein
MMVLHLKSEIAQRELSDSYPSLLDLQSSISNQELFNFPANAGRVLPRSLHL